MVATITDRFKKTLIQSLFDETSTEKYYIGIGRAESWPGTDEPPTPINSSYEEKKFRYSLQSIKLVEGTSFVAPRYNWISGTVYTSWDENVPGYNTVNPHYVINSANNVYICLERARDASGAPVPSTVEPTSTDTTNPFKTADNYVWKFLFEVTSTNATQFLSANFIPVRLIGLSPSGADEVTQKAVQDNATDGTIGSITVTSGGSGYQSTPTVVINGDGSGATATATIQNGQVVKVEMRSGSTYTPGSGFSYASISFSGGNPTTAATARANLSPAGGFGADPRNDLKSTGIMFQIKPDGSEGGDFIIDQDFRQIGLIKNPLAPNSSAFTAQTGKALKYLQFSSTPSGYSVDQTITGSSTNAQGIIDEVDTANNRIYYHQTDTTGFINFSTSDNIQSPGASVISPTSLGAAEVDNLSGEIMYVDNRSPVERADGQAEDLKIVIQL